MIVPRITSLQFNVSGDGRQLDCLVSMRCEEMFDETPIGILQAALLMHIVGHLTRLKPRWLHYSIADAYIYMNHISQVERQIKRVPHPFPTLSLRRPLKLKTLENFQSDSFIFEEYTSWPKISS